MSGGRAWHAGATLFNLPSTAYGADPETLERRQEADLERLLSYDKARAADCIEGFSKGTVE
jgi:hypothetical protein